MTHETTVPNEHLAIKIDTDPSNNAAKRVWLRLDVIKTAEIRDGFACFALTDYFGKTEPKSS